MATSGKEAGNEEIHNAATLTESSTTPPAFGHAMRKFWCFDEDYINLNVGRSSIISSFQTCKSAHTWNSGSYGAIPRPVIEACALLSTEIEANPEKFHRFTCLPRVQAVRERLAHLVGAQTDECVMVPSVSHGITTILRNFDWNPSDVLIASAYCTLLSTDVAELISSLQTTRRTSLSCMPWSTSLTHRRIRRCRCSH